MGYVDDYCGGYLNLALYGGADGCPDFEAAYESGLNADYDFPGLGKKNRGGGGKKGGGSRTKQTARKSQKKAEKAARNAVQKSDNSNKQAQKQPKAKEAGLGTKNGGVKK